MAIFVTGDTHGGGSRTYFPDGYLHRFSIRNFPEQTELTKDDFVIVCGDFGGVWDTNRLAVGESDAEKYELDWLESKPFTTLFVPGNHENYDRLIGCRDTRLLDSWFYAKMPDKEKDRLWQGYPGSFWHGGYVRKIRPSVLMLERGYVFEIDGANCFAFGGARSHDISGGVLHPADFPNMAELRTEAYRRQISGAGSCRVSGLSWWCDEVPAEWEWIRGERTLRTRPNIDFVFTHDAPSSSRILLGYETDDISSHLESLRGLMPHNTKWFFGHLHRDEDLPMGQYAMYKRILRIK